MLKFNILTYSSLLVLYNKRSFQFLITSLIQLRSFQKKAKVIVILGLYTYFHLSWLIAKVRQNLDLISTRRCWLRTQRKLLLRTDYFMMIWHQKVSQFTNLLFPKNLHLMVIQQADTSFFAGFEQIMKTAYFGHVRHENDFEVSTYFLTRSKFKKWANTSLPSSSALVHIYLNFMMSIYAMMKL